MVRAWPVFASATQSSTPSATSRVKTNRAPLGDQFGVPILAPFGSSTRFRGRPSSGTISIPVWTIVRCWAPRPGSIRTPASLRIGRANSLIGGYPSTSTSKNASRLGLRTTLGSGGVSRILTISGGGSR